MFVPCLATLVGRLAFATVFALLIAWLMCMPKSRIHAPGRHVAWWRDVRYWAVAVAASQLLLYLFWR